MCVTTVQASNQQSSKSIWRVTTVQRQAISSAAIFCGKISKKSIASTTSKITRNAWRASSLEEVARACETWRGRQSEQRGGERRDDHDTISKDKAPTASSNRPRHSLLGRGRRVRTALGAGIANCGPSHHPSQLPNTHLSMESGTESSFFTFQHTSPHRTPANRASRRISDFRRRQPTRRNAVSLIRLCRTRPGTRPRQRGRAPRALRSLVRSVTVRPALLMPTPANTWTTLPPPPHPDLSQPP